jgi:hypothetical protein
MALDINQLRAAFSKKSDEGSSDNAGFWDRFYPFYKMDFDQTSVFRFLPDLDDENPLGFIMENKYHELIINGKKKRIACLKMYGEACPCCEQSQKYYNEGDEKIGKAFWRKIDYIAQGVIISSAIDYPINDDENPVRLISMGPKLYKTIEAKIVKGDMDEMPYDMINGYDFRINKTKQGEYADYTTSDFARKSTPIPEALLSRIELYDLKNFRYGKIEREQVETMIEAFLTGKSYEDEKKDTPPDQGSSSTGSPVLDSALASPKETLTGESVVNAINSTPAESAPPFTGGKLSPQEILRKLKERQTASA